MRLLFISLMAVVLVSPTASAHAQLLEELAAACTRELKICPDGTGVGRTGPNCEFAPCPGEGEQDPPEPEDEQEDEPGGQEEGWSY